MDRKSVLWDDSMQCINSIIIKRSTRTCCQSESIPGKTILKCVYAMDLGLVINSDFGFFFF